MLQLDRLAQQAVIARPYPHAVHEHALQDVDALNDQFPSKDQFGPTIRMDGDLTAGDPGYEGLVSGSTPYRALHEQVYSTDFINTFLKLFRLELRRAYDNGELVADPFSLKIVPEPVERRVSGYAFVEGKEPFLYPRFDIGYAGVGYGVQNGGRGVHIDNLPRLISILVFLNKPRSMTGGTHRLYGLRGSEPVLERTYHPSPGLMIASMQSNRAFHDVAPITAIDGERRAFYMAVSCSRPIWKKEVHRELSLLSQNRYDAPAPSRWLRLMAAITGSR